MLKHMFPEGVSTALVGPSSLFRDGLKGVLHPPYRAEAVMERIDSVQQILDLDLIIVFAGTDQSAWLPQVRRAREGNAGARVVVLGDIATSEVVRQVLVAGANGYLLLQISPEALRASLDAVMLGGIVVLPAPTNAFTIDNADPANTVEAETTRPNAEADYNRLSNRETEILLCLAKGESNKHIARKCDISEATVKVHLKAILRKIRVRNRTQAAVWAHDNYTAR